MCTFVIISTHSAEIQTMTREAAAAETALAASIQERIAESVAQAEATVHEQQCAAAMIQSRHRTRMRLRDTRAALAAHLAQTEQLVTDSRADVQQARLEAADAMKRQTAEHRAAVADLEAELQSALAKPEQSAEHLASELARAQAVADAHMREQAECHSSALAELETEHQAAEER